MSRMANNPKAATAAKTMRNIPQADTFNKAGGRAYSKSAKVELADLLFSNFLSGDTYRKESEVSKRSASSTLADEDKEFLAKAALYTRNELGMRTMSHLLAGEIASKNYASGSGWGRTFFDAIVYRVDDMAEILGYFLGKDHKAIPNSLKSGFSSAFDRFDAYQLAKYRGDSNAVKLVDIVRLVHPKGNEKNKTALEQLVKGTLRNTKTWEAKVSAAGQKATSKEAVAATAEAWEDLLKENKLGYLALIRNLTNIANSVDDATFETALAQVIDEKSVKTSLVLPFQLYIAAKQVENEGRIKNHSRMSKVIDALTAAIDVSLSNVPKLEGKTLVAVDISGSMDSRLSAMGQARVVDVATLFGVVLAKANDADLVRFNTSASYSVVPKSRSTLDSVKSLAQTGGGTAFESIMYLINQSQTVYDRILVLSDMQSWSGKTGGDFARLVQEYRNNKKRPNMTFLSWDLHGGTSHQVPESDPRSIVLGGWSDKIFDILAETETDRNALVKTIEEYEIKVPTKERARKTA